MPPTSQLKNPANYFQDSKRDTKESKDSHLPPASPANPALAYYAWLFSYDCRWCISWRKSTQIESALPKAATTRQSSRLGLKTCTRVMFFSGICWKVGSLLHEKLQIPWVRGILAPKREKTQNVPAYKKRLFGRSRKKRRPVRTAKTKAAMMPSVDNPSDIHIQNNLGM